MFRFAVPGVTLTLGIVAASSCQRASASTTSAVSASASAPRGAVAAESKPAGTGGKGGSAEESEQRRVIVAVDHSRDSLHAVDWAIENHLRPSDLVTMLHVQSPTEALTAPGIYAALGDTTMSEAAMDQLLVRTEERQIAVNAELKRLLLLRCSNAELQCEVRVVRDADPRERIVAEVADRDADVLILGSRGMGPVKRMLIGSVSDYCVNHAPCPVVVVKPSSFPS
ncbi:hypothetical protein CLOM_g22298 [Closterium sp. NIES-68]|nr:hypothetical protein CLOM_g22298 [Closterium sp. NIES-68]GJP64427.1 hypothetical protein CLOP_g21421 [Closterium sp. NIES-67]